MDPKTEKLLQDSMNDLLAYAKELREQHKAGKLTTEQARKRADCARAAFTAVRDLLHEESPFGPDAAELLS